MPKKRNVKSKKRKKKIDWSCESENPLMFHEEEYYVKNGELIQEKLKERGWVMLIGGDGIKREYLVKKLVADYVEEKNLPILKHVKDFITQEDINMSYYKRIDLKGCDSNQQAKFILGHDIEKTGIELLIDGEPLNWLHKTGGGLILSLLDNPNMLLYLDNLNCDNVSLLHAFFESVFKSEEIQHCQLEPDPARLSGHLIVSVKSEDFDRLSEEWWHMFYIVDFETIAEKKERHKKLNTQNKDSQKAKQKKKKAKQKKKLDIQTDNWKDIVSVEKILYYNKSTGCFRFGKYPPEYVSDTAGTKSRHTAEVLMKHWIEKTPCTPAEIMSPLQVRYKIPQWVYDKTSEIRKILKNFNVFMPNMTDSEYLPPKEPKKFAFDPEN